MSIGGNAVLLDLIFIKLSFASDLSILLLMLSIKGKQVVRFPGDWESFLYVRVSLVVFQIKYIVSLAMLY